MLQPADLSRLSQSLYSIVLGLCSSPALLGLNCLKGREVRMGSDSHAGEVVRGHQSRPSVSCKGQGQEVVSRFLCGVLVDYTHTVTRKNVAGIDVVSLRGLVFWLLKSRSSSFCSSPVRPFFSADSNAFMVGP